MKKIYLFLLMALVGSFANAQTKTWALAGNGNWNTPANWTPAGVPGPNDNVIFNNTAAITVTLDFTSSTTINSIAVSGTANVTLATNANRTINLGGANTSGTALSVVASRSLVLNATADNAGVTLSIPTGYTASINGGIALDAFNAGNLLQTNKLIAVDANSVQVNSGGQIAVNSNNTGNPFGDYNNVDNIVVFNSGARFVTYAGNHPFGSPSGAGIAQFKPGSMFIAFGGSNWNVEGRTYSTVIIGSGGTYNNSFNSTNTTTTIDSLIVNSGTVNLYATGTASPSFSINNISLGLTGTGTSILTLGSDAASSTPTSYSINGNILLGNNTTATTTTLRLGQHTGTGSSSSTITFTGVGKSLDFGILGTKTISQSDVSGATYSTNYVIAPNASFTFNKSFTLATSITSSSLTVQPLGALTIGSGVTFTSNGKLKLESNATGSGRIAANNGTINGNVVVERFIPGGRRAFRFLAHPFDASIALSQIMATSGANTGIDITGSGAGFTNSGTNNPSAFSYNPVIGNSSSSPDPGWTAFTSASTTSWDAKQGIRVLVRGTKGEGLDGIPYTPSATTISMSGVLNDGTSPVFNLTNGTNSDYNLIGNPLASTIDMQAVVRGGANVGNNYYVWDPNSGAAGAYFAEPFSTASTYRYLPMGSAFFATTTSTGTISFPESAKAGNAPAALLRGSSAYGANSIQLEIKDNAGLKHDRILLFFNDNTSSSLDVNDGTKMTNPGVNFFTTSTDGKRLSIDTRPFEINSIIPVVLNINADNNFKISIADFNLNGTKDVFLHDKKTGAYVALGNGVEYSFNALLNDATTHGNRFELVMRSSAALSTTFLNLTAVAKNNGIELNWNTSNEVNMHTYEVEESRDGRNFVKATIVEAKNAATNSYNYFDAAVFNGDNFYRIKSVEKNGAVKYSNIIKLNIGGKSEFSVYPNPIKGAVVNLLLSNVDKGVYTVRIYNNAGQEIASKLVQHNGGSATQTLSLGKQIATGMYNMQISNGVTTITKTLIVE